MLWIFYLVSFITECNGETKNILLFLQDSYHKNIDNVVLTK